MRLAHISHEINPSCRAPREATQQATELTTGPEKPWKTQRLCKCLRAPCDEEKRWCLTQGCITNTSKNVKSEIYCSLVNWWLMKGYFEAEKSASVRHKSQKKAKGKSEGCRLLPVLVTRCTSLSFNADLPVSSNVQRELLQAQGGRSGTICKSHRLIFTV